MADFRPATRVLEVSQALVVNFAYIHCTAFVIYTDALKYARVGSISIGCQVGGRWEPHVKTASIDMPASQFAPVGTSLSLKLADDLEPGLSADDVLDRAGIKGGAVGVSSGDVP